MKELTRAEDQIMRILWRLGKAFVKDILSELEEPKPAYNTVSTIIRILETKGFVSHTAYGKTHHYFPLVSQEAYTGFLMNNMVRNYFDNSFQEMVSFFTSGRNMSVTELEEIISLIKDEISKKKSKP